MKTTIMDNEAREQLKAAEQHDVQNMAKGLVEEYKEMAPVVKVTLDRLTEGDVDLKGSPAQQEASLTEWTKVAINEALSAGTDDEFAEMILPLFTISEDASGSAEAKVQSRREELRQLVEFSELDSVPDTMKPLQTKIRSRINFAKKAVDLFVARKKDYGADAKVNLQKNLGLLPPDQVNAAPLAQTGSAEVTPVNPPPAPGSPTSGETPPPPSQEGQTTSAGEAPAQGVPLSEEGAVSMIQSKTREVEEAMKSGDMKKAEKMLGQLKTFWNSEDGKKLRKIGEGSVLGLYGLLVGYIILLWVATRYRGGGK